MVLVIPKLGRKPPHYTLPVTKEFPKIGVLYHREKQFYLFYDCRTAALSLVPKYRVRKVGQLHFKIYDPITNKIVAVRGSLTECYRYMHENLQAIERS